MNFSAMVMAAADPVGAATGAPAAHNQMELFYIWDQATPEAKAIIVVLIIFSIFAWSVMMAKALHKVLDKMG